MVAGNRIRRCFLLGHNSGNLGTEDFFRFSHLFRKPYESKCIDVNLLMKNRRITFWFIIGENNLNSFNIFKNQLKGGSSKRSINKSGNIYFSIQQRLIVKGGISMDFWSTVTLIIHIHLKSGVYPLSGCSILPLIRTKWCKCESGRSFYRKALKITNQLLFILE